MAVGACTVRLHTAAVRSLGYAVHHPSGHCLDTRRGHGAHHTTSTILPPWTVTRAYHLRMVGDGPTTGYWPSPSYSRPNMDVSWKRERASQDFALDTSGSLPAWTNTAPMVMGA